jgi:hypothetical protein
MPHGRSEHAFMRAILADAVQCLFGAVSGSRRDRGRLALQARAWVSEREPTAPLGFEDVCHALDLDPEAVRRRLLEIADHAASGAGAPPGVGAALETLIDGGLLRAAGEAEGRTWRGKIQRNAEMLSLRQAGWPLRALAARFGVSVSRACTICVQAERARPAGDVTASRRSAMRSDAAAPPSAAGRTSRASTSAPRRPFPAAAEESPAAPADTRSPSPAAESPPERRRVQAEP